MSQCDTCVFMVYDEEYEDYICEVDMDEDDYGQMMTNSNYKCPYYRDGDDYKIVKHQL